MNLSHIPDAEKRENQTIKTSDDYSYLNPAENYINYGEWKQDGASKQSYFVRTPGYGLFYYALLKTIGTSKALSFLKFIQLILFSLSIYCFFYIANHIIQHKVMALIGAIIYGCTPFAIGFLYYTLTEGITPALLLFYIYFLLKAYNKKHLGSAKQFYYLIASIVFAYLLITRPVLGVFGLLFPLILVKDYYNYSIKKMVASLFVFGLISISLISAWEIRNYRIVNQYVGIYSIYYPDNNSIYRPTLEQFWNFNKSWGVEGHVYHSYSAPFWLETIKGDTTNLYINKIIDAFPTYVVDFYGEQRLYQVMKKYQASIIFQKQFYDKGLPMPMKTPQLEQEVVFEFKKMTTEFKEKFWFQYHISTPSKVFKTMAFHSNLSLYIFQHTYRGYFLMETVRVIFVGIHALAFISILISLLLFKKNDALSNILSLLLFTYIFFLCYYQRGIEERYTLPILPLLLISLLSVLKKIQSMILSRR